MNLMEYCGCGNAGSYSTHPDMLWAEIYNLRPALGAGRRQVQVQRSLSAGLCNNRSSWPNDYAGAEFQSLTNRRAQWGYTKEYELHRIT